MLGTNTKAFLKPWGVSVEIVVTEDGSETTKQFLGIVSAPGRQIEFGGIPVVSDDYTLLFATEDVAITERDKITVMNGAHAGRYSVREVTASSDKVFTTAKLSKIL